MPKNFYGKITIPVSKEWAVPYSRFYAAVCKRIVTYAAYGDHQICAERIYAFN